MELPEATAREGVLCVLNGRARHAAYFLLEQSGQVVAQLMITLEWSDWWVMVAHVGGAAGNGGKPQLMSGVTTTDEGCVDHALQIRPP